MFEQFLKERQFLKNISPLTVRSYKQAWDRYSKYGKENIPTKLSLNQFVIGMREAGLSPTSCNISIRAINSYLSWLFENEFITTPLRAKQLKEEKKAMVGYSDEDIKVILGWKPKGRYELRLYTLICLLFDTGLRIEEVLTLTRENIDLENLLVTVRGKGNKERIVPISIQCRQILCKYFLRHNFDVAFCTRHGNRLSYRNILRDWYKVCERLRIEVKPFHYLRRTFAKNYITQGGSLFMLQRCLGHESITTTQRYVALQVEDLKDVHQKSTLLSRLR